MIKFDDVKVTPKQFAVKAIRVAIESAYYWSEKGYCEIEEVTERETDLINAQLEKLHSRISKLLRV